MNYTQFLLTNKKLISKFNNSSRIIVPIIPLLKLKINKNNVILVWFRTGVVVGDKKMMLNNKNSNLILQFGVWLELIYIEVFIDYIKYIAKKINDFRNLNKCSHRKRFHEKH